MDRVEDTKYIIDELRKLIEQLESDEVWLDGFSWAKDIISVAKGKGYQHIFTGREHLELALRRENYISEELPSLLKKALDA